MNTLTIRTLTGLLFVAIMVAGICYDALTYGLLFMVITALVTDEFVRLVNRYVGVQVSRVFAVLGSAYLFGALLFANFYLQRMGIEGATFKVLVTALVIYLMLCIYLLVRGLYQRNSHALTNWAYTIFAQVYVALPFALLNVLAYGYGDHYFYLLPLTVFVLLWMCDTGAYCVGCTLGKHKLFPRISPKKSWEGAVGGVFFAVGTAVTIGVYQKEVMSLPQWIGFGLVIAVFGIWGDLVESLIKRELGVKDSGNALPGHGGWLDRFDSALLAIPAVVVYWEVMQCFC